MPDREGVQAVKGGPSEAPVCRGAVKAILDEMHSSMPPWLTDDDAATALTAAAEPIIRADQTLRIVEWLRDPNTQAAAYRQGVVSASGFADLIAREFGGTTHE